MRRRGFLAALAAVIAAPAALLKAPAPGPLWPPLAEPLIPVEGIGYATTDDVAGWLKETYNSDFYFKPFQNDYTPMLSDLHGSRGWRVPFNGRWNGGAPTWVNNRRVGNRHTARRGRRWA